MEEVNLFLLLNHKRDFGHQEEIFSKGLSQDSALFKIFTSLMPYKRVPTFRSLLLPPKAHPIFVVVEKLIFGY